MGPRPLRIAYRAAFATSALSLTGFAWAALPAGAAGRDSGPLGEIPAFARRYRTSCSTCHTAAPKLNVLGEAFRLNGYRFPDNDALLRKEKPVPLGAEPWKEEWPRAIWPGELPAIPPVAFRIVNDIRATSEEGSEATWDLRFPEELYVLAGGSLGESIGFFLESEWTKEEGFEVIQAKVELQDVVPGLTDRLLNLWVGQQNFYLLTFGDRQIDRAARVRFLWSDFAPSRVTLRNPVTGDELLSENDLRLRLAQPAIELNGLLGSRAYYGIGVSQGDAEGLDDNNDAKDIYYKLRYKIGGLALDGTYDPDGGPVLETGGQLQDHAVILEHFGYVGRFPVANGLGDDHRAFGAAVRWLNGPLDLGAGYVWREHRNPWGLDPARHLASSSAFGKLEYLVYPWLMASLKADVLETAIAEELRDEGFTEGLLDATRLMPGVVVLVRQNVRAVLEGEIFARHRPTDEVDLRAPHNLWIRLDVAF